MVERKLILSLATACVALSPALAHAQDIGVARSDTPDLPYTIFFPQPMATAGGAGEPLLINHPAAPLQCSLEVVPVEEPGWTPQGALDMLDEAQIATAWEETLPGFGISNTQVVQYRDAQALLYEGGSLGSNLGMPLTLVHTESVAEGRGYVLDCLYATAEAEQARPFVDFIIANFSTRQDTECCAPGSALPVPPEASAASETPAQ